MGRLDQGNLGTEVVLGKTRTERLRDLLPEHDWPEGLA